MARFGLAVSMSDVAAEAGMSRGSLYRYFGDRDALVAAVLARTADQFVAAGAQRMVRRRTLSGQFAEAVTYVADAAQRLGLDREGGRRSSRRDSPLVLVLVNHSNWLVDRWMELWVQLLEQAAERGEVRADVDLRASAEWLTRVLLSFAVAPQVAVDPSDHRAVRRFVDGGVLGGLTA